MWILPGRVIWAVNGVDRSNGLTCSDAHGSMMMGPLKNDASRRQFHACADTTSLNRLKRTMCTWGGFADVINSAIFSENPPKGFGAVRPRKRHFPLTSFIALTAVSVGTTVPHCDVSFLLGIANSLSCPCNFVRDSPTYRYYSQRADGSSWANSTALPFYSIIQSIVWLF